MNRRERRKRERLGRGHQVPPPAAAAASADLDRLFDEAATFQEQGRTGEAAALLRQILARAPEHSHALNLSGILAFQAGRHADGMAMIRRALAQLPEEASFHNNLGTALSALGRREEARLAYERAVELKPRYAPALNNLGTVLRRLGRLEESAAAYGRALEANPRFAEVHSNLGNALLDLGRVEAAAASFRRAIELEPRLAIAHNNLGNALKRLGDYGAAIDAYGRALGLVPDYADALNNMAEALKDLGRAEEALDFYRQALEAAAKSGADEAGMGSNLLFALNAVPDVAAADVFAEHRRWAERHAEPLKASWRRHDNAPDPERRLRVGYLSPDFRRHSVAYFVAPLLAAHDRARVEVFCYASVLNPDAVTDRLKGLADRWRDVAGATDDEAAERIRADGIDVLVDLGGHTGNSRLLVLARKPAPLQGIWLGYPNTSGMTAVDFRVTDPIADPEGAADALHSERLVRLPAGLLCYEPPADAPEAGALPAFENGFVRFASCNNLAKVAAPVVETWARILKRVPGARLLLKSKPLAHAGARRLVAERFQAHGVGADRLDLLGWIVDGTHLEAYRRVDIGLDTFPYNGTTTTCEALWMGVPVVTLAGDRHAGRVGASLLARVGLEHLVARSADAYVERAVALAGDLGALAELRRGLRGRIAASPLRDAAGFANSLEAAYRRLWREWCAGRIETC